MISSASPSLEHIISLTHRCEQALEQGLFDEVNVLLEQRLMAIQAYFQSLPHSPTQADRDFFAALLKRDQRNVAYLEQQKQTIKQQRANTNKTYKAISKYINIKGL